MNIVYFDMLSKDILYLILSNMNKNLTYPLLFVCKRLNKYVTDKKIIYNILSNIDNKITNINYDYYDHYL